MSQRALPCTCRVTYMDICPPRAAPAALTGATVPTWDLEEGRQTLPYLQVRVVHPSKSLSFGEPPSEFCLPKYISELNSQTPLQQGHRHMTPGSALTVPTSELKPRQKQAPISVCGSAFRVALVTRSASGGRRDRGCSGVSPWQPAQWQLLQWPHLPPVKLVLL